MIPPRASVFVARCKHPLRHRLNGIAVKTRFEPSHDSNIVRAAIRINFQSQKDCTGDFSIRRFLRVLGIGQMQPLGALTPFSPALKTFGFCEPAATPRTTTIRHSAMPVSNTSDRGFIIERSSRCLPPLVQAEIDFNGCRYGDGPPIFLARLELPLRYGVDGIAIQTSVE